MSSANKSDEKGMIHNKFNLKISLIIFYLLTVLLTSSALAKGYIVGDGDTLKISVYNHPDLSTTVRVSGDEDILLPLLGRVHVGGLTVSKVADQIASLLADGYIVNPQVNVFIEEFRSKKVIILGQISRPGVYELSGSITFLELISKAGGLTDNAGDQAVIKRKDINSDKDITKKINIKSLLQSGNLKENIVINDGDNVYIEKAGICYVTGEVVRPGAYKIDEKTTAIKAITLAGGFTGKATRKKVNIIRIIDNDKKTLEGLALNEKIYDEDIIIVPESFF
ncbi:MAG: polysaccharide export protein [Desulfobulbaceae bacterium]|nr:polysaccharide export protein [Desulfobulbaceae bacterium]